MLSKVFDEMFSFVTDKHPQNTSQSSFYHKPTIKKSSDNLSRELNVLDSIRSGNKIECIKYKSSHPCQTVSHEHGGLLRHKTHKYSGRTLSVLLTILVLIYD